MARKTIVVDLMTSAFQELKKEIHKEESVDHPAHYGGADNPYECIKVVDAWGLGFSLGNAIKYIARAGRKDQLKHVEDLEKARWYLDHEIARLKSETDA